MLFDSSERLSESPDFKISFCDWTQATLISGQTSYQVVFLATSVIITEFI